MTVKTTDHTPGPWHVKIRQNETLILDAAGNLVALADWDDKANHADKAQADAALIAAAPYMAEALREVKRCMAVMQETDALPTDTCPADLFDMVSTALAKAGL